MASSGLDARVAEPPAFRLVTPPQLQLTLPPELETRWRAEAALTPRQLTTVRRALQALAAPPHAFFLGDGPGTGKTRILAGVALAAPKGLVRLWYVPNATLMRQAREELRLLGEDPEVQLRTYGQADAAAPPGPFVLLLDEAHLLRNDCRKSSALLALQRAARCVLYATATPASEVSSLGYMERLGLWGGADGAGGFPDFEAFRTALRRWGLGAAELLALELKKRGLYSCVRLPEVPVQHLELFADEETRRVFDGCIAAWRAAPAAARHGFFLRLVTSLKARLLLPRWRQDLAAGRAVVVVLQGTGAAAAGDEGGSMLRRCCLRAGVAPPPELPQDALDLLRAAFDASELSGRAVRARGDAAVGNARELRAFRAGERRFLVMSAAGSLGLNLTSPLPLRLYVLEAPWTPEVMAQQLGRCHRLSSDRVPEYYIASLRTFVERRVEAALARRSGTLGAVSCADQGRRFFAALPWCFRLVRWVTLELVARALLRRRPPPAFDAEEDEVLLLSVLPRSPLLSHAGAADAALARLPPSARAWALPAWTPATHRSFPPAERGAARTAALCLARARLPPPLVGLVLAFALGSDDWDVEAELPSLGGALDATRPAEFLEACCAAPLACQGRLLRCCEAHAERCQPKPQRVQHVRDRSLRRARGYEASVSSEPRGRDVLVRVEARSTARPAEAPLLLAQRQQGWLLCATEEAGVWKLRRPGGEPLRSYDSLEALLQVEARPALLVGALRRFRDLEASVLALHATRALCLYSHSYLLAVDDALERWEESQRTVLAAEDAQGRPFVGLLLAET